MDLITMTEEALESLGYKQVKLLQATQNNLALIEQELAKRQQLKEQSNDNS